MATVTSFESLPHPTRSELRQFAELFSPLFTASSDEARRQAVAALSQSQTVPPAVAFFIASQPIAISAPFLIASPCLSNEALIAIARTQGVDHAHAIARRDSLSPIVLDALVGLRYARPAQPAEARTPAQDDTTRALEEAREAERLLQEEKLRGRIKILAGHVERAENDRLGLRTVSSIHTALLVRFARAREAGLFAGVLADALSASRWLAERIMLDVSGRQLATTLKGVFMEQPDALFILERFYSHLSTVEESETSAETLWHTLDTDECGRRVEAWRRADRYTYAEPLPQPTDQVPPDVEPVQAEEPAAPLRTSASLRRNVGGQWRR
ncbi:DUF2336 domain-containing protein [Neorhizobium lilium]|uniref:DUF2336 domain-containing protein n=2 Tax=Neorhizobium lilium TaxID=2503024 RepID=A0A3S3SBE9_9HYPH|nr:DUF2336 domain-containing protein [Neorhizobium lilium]